MDKAGVGSWAWAALGLLGCASSQADGNATAVQPTSTATAEVVATTSPTTTAEASVTTATVETAQPASSASSPKGKKSFRFEAYNGPKAKKTFADTPVAWVVRPAGADGSFEQNKLALMAFLRTQGDDVVVQYEGGELAVPMALALPAATPAGLKGGDVVFSNVGNFGAVAKVQSVDEKKGVAKIKYVVGADVQEKEISRQAMLRLDDRVSFGRPVGFKDGEAWISGLYAGGDTAKGFVALGKGWKIVDAKVLKPLKITGNPLAKDAKVLAARDGKLLAGTVEEVLDGGVRYKVKLADGKQATLGFDAVTPPFE